MYLNRENINIINELRELWGASSFAQTNSRYNGSYLEHVRLYDTTEDKAKKTNYIELCTKKELTDKIAELKIG